MHISFDYISTKKIFGCRVYILSLLILLSSCSCIAQETVEITLPSSVTFNVTDVNQNTDGTPDITNITFSGHTGYALGIYIQADAENFTRPGTAGGYIPASKVCVEGNGTNPSGGSLEYGLVAVYEFDNQTDNFEVTWQLNAPGTTVRGGAHTLTATWVIQSL